MIDTERLCLGCMNDNGGEKICSICGFDSKQENPEEALKIGGWLRNRYLIGNAADINGEGITYIGWDNKEDAIVNIKEYFPKGVATRNEDKSVSITKGEEFAFNNGLMSFLELNRKLMQLSSLPALLPIEEVFEHNGTAYVIIKASSTIPLREFLIRNGGDLNWEQARSLFAPLITTLIGLHKEGIIHRGISPETVLVGRDGKLRLGGICIRAVRVTRSDLATQLYPGFSAVEQYGYDIDCVDGKYTDVYGVAATLFRVLMGKAPIDVAERLVNDNMQIPSRLAETLPKYVLSALANALQVMPQNRIQDMDSFRLALTPVGAETQVTPVPVQKPAPVQKAAPVAKPAPVSKADKKEEKKSSAKAAVIAATITAVAFIFIAIAVYFLFLKPPVDSNIDENPSSSEQASIPTNSETIILPADNDKLYQVPNFEGKKYADLLDDTSVTMFFNFEVTDKQFSDTYPRGTVISQTPGTEQAVKKGTTIEVVLSLGPKTTALPNLVGKTYDEAVFELLKLGFDYNNIKQGEKLYDATQKTGVIIKMSPEAGTKVDTDTRVVLSVNYYDPDGESSASSDTQSKVE